MGKWKFFFFLSLYDFFCKKIVLLLNFEMVFLSPQ